MARQEPLNPRGCVKESRQRRFRFTTGLTMKLNLAHSHPMGTLIVEGVHQPFRALACALRPTSIKIQPKANSVQSSVDQHAFSLG